MTVEAPASVLYAPVPDFLTPDVLTSDVPVV